MNTLTIQVEDKNVLSSLKRVLKSMNGVVIVSPSRGRKKTGIEQGMDDVRNGRVTEYESADDMFKKLGI